MEAAQGQLREAQTRHREEAAKAKHSETLLLQVPEPYLGHYLGLYLSLTSPYLLSPPGARPLLSSPPI